MMEPNIVLCMYVCLNKKKKINRSSFLLITADVFDELRLLATVGFRNWKFTDGRPGQGCHQNHAGMAQWVIHSVEILFKATVMV